MLKLLLANIGIMAAAISQALPEDRLQPVNIEADRAELSHTAGRTVYEGNVKLSQGSLRINADRLVITLQNGTVSELTANGSQAVLEQLISADKPPLNARADTIVYRVGDELLLLTGNALVVQGESTIASNRIEYLINSGGIKADERVRLTLPTQPTATE